MSWTWALLRAGGELGPALRDARRSSPWAQRCWLAERSEWPRDGNHVPKDVVGLALGAVLFACEATAAGRRLLARRCDELAEQVGADGVHDERCEPTVRHVGRRRGRSSTTTTGAGGGRRGGR